MAKKTYIGVNNKSREVKCIYIGISGIVKRVKQAFVGGKDGKPKLAFCDHEYEYNNATYTWSNDFSSCKATLPCANCSAVSYETTYQIVEETNSRNCNEYDYKATFSNINIGDVWYSGAGWLTRDDDAHSWTNGSCTVCGVTCTQHSDSDGDNICDTCGENLQAPHEHTWVINSGNAQGHGYICSSCGASKFEYEDHSWTDGRCAIQGCNYECKHPDNVVSSTVTKVATCAAEGEATNTCTTCEFTWTSSIDKLPHNYENAQWRPNESNPASGHYMVCQNWCGQGTKDSNHTFDVIDTQPATCVTLGQTTYQCKDLTGTGDSGCGYTYTEFTETVDKNAHDWVDANCTTPKTCKACGATKGEPLGHAWHYQPNTDGTTHTKWCDICHIEITNEEHTFENDDGSCICGAAKACDHSNYTDDTTATCTKAGIKTRTCNDCGQTISTLYQEALGHNWDDGEETTAPGCETEGVMTYTCRRCGDTDTESIPATGHTQNDMGLCENCGACMEHVGDAGTVDTAPGCATWGTTLYHCVHDGCDGTWTETDIEPTENHSWEDSTSATCTIGGNKSRSCQDCGKYEDRGYEGPLGHDWNTTKNPTCVDDGTKKCDRCGASEPIDAYDHDWKTTKNPTCTDDGTKKCDRCGASESIPATGVHTPNEMGLCEDCGACVEHNYGPPQDDGDGPWRQCTNCDKIDYL